MPAAAKNEAFGNFGLPSRHGSVFRHVAPAGLFATLLFTVGAQLVTQWLARALAYQAALGEPLFLMRTTPIFAPWAGIRWAHELQTASGGTVLARQATTWFLFAGFLSFAFGALVFGRRVRAERNRAAELHGSARWATRNEIERAGLFARAGVVVGKWVDRNLARYLRHDGGEHVLVFAPTGSGKGVGLVLPTLLTWQESVFVLDPKGENFAKTSGYRRHLGHKVFKVDFAAHPSLTAAFNPMDTVRVGTVYETADAQRLAGLICDPDGKQSEGSNKHWAVTSSSLMTGAILHVLYRERLQGRRGTLLDVLAELTDKHRTHREVMLSWLEFAHDPRFVQGWTDRGEPTATNDLVASTAREQLNREEKERNSVLSTAVSNLSIFRDPLLAANTSRSDFAIEDLMDAAEPHSVYFVLRPDDVERLRPIVRIVVDLAIRRLLPPMEVVGGELVNPHPRRLLMLLDEFPILGRLNTISQALAYVRGWGIRFYLITQDYEQLRDNYGDRETISSNCKIKVVYAPDKFETAKFVSQMTGTATIIKRVRSSSLSFGTFASNKNSDSEQEVSRPLLTPDECMRLPGPVKNGKDIVQPGDMLLFFAGASPIYGQQPLFFKDPTLLTRSRIASAPARPQPHQGARDHRDSRGMAPTTAAPEVAPETAAAMALLSSAAIPPAPCERSLPTAPCTEFDLDPELMAQVAGLSESSSDEDEGYDDVVHEHDGDAEPSENDAFPADEEEPQ